ncbi:MAG: HAD-IIIC family phosphatase [Gammaproteobacteria bacterium]
MYETEANGSREAIDQIPPEIQSRFREFGDTILARTVMPWGEHCTECVWPTCYTTCDLYSPRADHRCRRFVDGIVRIESPGSPNGYLLKIRFKRWGKLWSPGNVRLYASAEAQRLERNDHRIGSTLFHLPLPGPARKAINGLRYDLKKRSAQAQKPSTPPATSLILECYNPGDRQIAISLTLRSLSAAVTIPFQKLLEASPGFVRFRIPVGQIPSNLLNAPFDIELIPNDIADDTTLYFGVMDFVREVTPPAVGPTAGQTIKCVVWDLDQTLWTGVLIEDGAARLTLKPGVSDVIRELDRRGILNSIASKNNFEEAWETLKTFQLDEFFLAAQISWMPKSESISAIAKQLNIGIDSLLFIDDSPFELEQVRSVCPDVRVLDASEYLTLPDLPECQVSITAEGSSRRKMYQEQWGRIQALQTFGEDYLGFLKECGLELTIGSLGAHNIERVHELTQRTNQMNFSGTRYSLAVLQGVLTTEHLDTYVLSCRDRFGSYGLIGFALVDRREPRLTDLMFSCRVQSKRVEHAFMTWLLRRYLRDAGWDVWANYRKTPRNAPSGRVFAEVGMEEVAETDGVTSLVFRRDRQVPDDGIVTIRNECVLQER